MTGVGTLSVDGAPRLANCRTPGTAQGRCRCPRTPAGRGRRRGWPSPSAWSAAASPLGPGRVRPTRPARMSRAESATGHPLRPKRCIHYANGTLATRSFKPQVYRNDPKKHRDARRYFPRRDSDADSKTAIHIIDTVR